jgi:hypothetical protein
MDAVKASLGSAFDSKRLLFRPLEFNEGDMNYISVHLRSDPVSTGLTLPALHRPFSRTISDELAKTQMESALLTVKVCVGGSLHSTAIGTLHITEVGKYQRRATIAVQIAQGYQVSTQCP